jgi:hypothetical protein
MWKGLYGNSLKGLLSAIRGVMMLNLTPMWKQALNVVATMQSKGLNFKFLVMLVGAANWAVDIRPASRRPPQFSLPASEFIALINPKVSMLSYLNFWIPGL